MFFLFTTKPSPLQKDHQKCLKLKCLKRKKTLSSNHQTTNTKIQQLVLLDSFFTINLSIFEYPILRDRGFFINSRNSLLVLLTILKHPWIINIFLFIHLYVGEIITCKISPLQEDHQRYLKTKFNRPLIVFHASNNKHLANISDGFISPQ